MSRFHTKRLLLAALITLLVYLHLSSNRNSFYSRTVKALDKHARDQQWKEATDAKIEKILADRKGRSVGLDSSKLARASAPSAAAATTVDKKVPKYPLATTVPPLPTTQIPTPSSAATTLLDALIATHPILIFSKSYCPHSLRAKTLLVETYAITPPPYVVELDLLTELAGDETMGAALQRLLAKRTGRTTVPNVLVRGQSLGGGDEMGLLDEQWRLCAKVKSYGGGLVERCERVEKWEVKKAPGHLKGGS